MELFVKYEKACKITEKMENFIRERLGGIVHLKVQVVDTDS